MAATRSVTVDRRFGVATEWVADFAMLVSAVMVTAGCLLLRAVLARGFIRLTIRHRTIHRIVTRKFIRRSIILRSSIDLHSCRRLSTPDRASRR